MTTSDVPEPQVAISSEADSCYPWHAKVVAVVVPLNRSAPVPDRVASGLYGFEVLDEDQLLLTPGTVALPVLEADWRFADTAFDRFGETVALDLVQNTARFVVRESTTLVRVEDDGELIWTTAERLMPKDVEAWNAEKRAGPGRERRILQIRRDARGHRYATLREALTDMTVSPSPAPADWPFRRQSAVHELLTAARAAGEEISGFRDYFVRSSGVPSEHSVAHKHRDLLGVLAHAVSFDQIDAPQSAALELVARLVLQIHQATRRCPRNPDFRGTTMMTSSTLGASGGVLVGGFARFIAEEQKSEAFTLKQQRLYAEEEDKRAGGRKGPDGAQGKK